MSIAAFLVCFTAIRKYVVLAYGSARTLYVR